MENMKNELAKDRQDVRQESFIKKRSLVIGGHRTSVSLEDEFWEILKAISARWKLNLSQLVGRVDAGRSNANLSSALRLFVLNYMRKQIERCEATCDASKLHQLSD